MIDDAPRAPSAAPRTIGSGLMSAPIAFGCWRFAGTPLREARAVIEAAAEAGVTLLDTAAIYGVDGQGFGAAEALLGEVFAEAPDLRDRFAVASKGGIIPGVPYAGSKADLLASCEASLDRLGLDALDLFMVHRPDHLTHPAETAEALAALVETGKAKAVGVSNYSAAQCAALAAHMETPLAVNQIEVSPFRLEALFDGALDFAMGSGMGVIAWSPLAGGRIATGNTEGLAPDAAERLRALIEKLDEVAAREGASRTSVALAWVLRHPADMVAILGTQKAERIREASGAFSVKLSRADWYAIAAAGMGKAWP